MVELLPLDPEDWLDEDDRAALHRALKDSDEDIAAGRLVDAEVDDVLTAFGILDFNKTAWKQTGTILDEPTNSDLFFCDARKVGNASIRRSRSTRTMRFRRRCFIGSRSRPPRKGRKPGNVTFITGTVAVTSCCLCVQERSTRGAQCHTRSWAPQTTFRTKAIGQSAVSGNSGDRWPRVSSGRRGRQRLMGSSGVPGSVTG